MKVLNNNNNNTVHSSIVSGGIWSGGVWSSGYDKESELYPINEYKETLDINWSKLKETIGEESYNKIVRDSVKKWMDHDNNNRTDSLLKHEGLLDTKRENSLNNLLDEEDKF